MKRQEAFNIPNIFESLANDLNRGASWEKIAEELYRAGHISLNSASLAKKRLHDYLKRNSQVWYRVCDPRWDKKNFLYITTDGRPKWTAFAECADFFSSVNDAFRAAAKYGFEDFADVEAVKGNGRAEG